MHAIVQDYSFKQLHTVKVSNTTELRRQSDLVERKSRNPNYVKDFMLILHKALSATKKPSTT